MGLYTYVSQYQLYKSETYDDAVTPGGTMESGAVDIESDLNALRSQVKYLLGETNWYDAITGRDVKELGTDLTTMEDQRKLCRTEVLTDITVPAAAASTGTINCVSVAEMVNGEKVVINDGTRTVTFWSDVSGSYSPPGGYDATNIEVDVSGATTADDVKAIYITAINGATIDITASSGGSGVVTLTHDANGANNYAITHTVADTDFSVVGMSGGTGDVVVLSQSASETPSIAAAVDAGTYEGAVVKVLTADFGGWSLDEVGGANNISPKTLLIIREADSGDPLTSSNRTIYGLFQAEPGVVDGDSFNDTDHQCQISFVRLNAEGNDLERCPAADIAGKAINYSYVRRYKSKNVPEDAYLIDAYIDASGIAGVTLDNAIDNQVGPATQNQNIEVRITDTYSWKFEDSTGVATILGIAAAAGGDSVEMNLKTLDINNTDAADFLNGIKVDTGGTQISLGDTAGTLASAGKLDITTTAADLSLLAGGYLVFSDQYYAASGYDTPLVLSDSSAEWNDFETYFGEVSLLNAINQAYKKAKFDTASAKLTADVNQDTNVSGTTAPVYLDATLLDYDGKTITTDMAIYLNGIRLRAGANSGTTYDVYPGTDPTYGDLMFKFKVKTGNVITMDVY